MLVGMQLYDLWFHCLWWIQRRETRSAVTRRGSQVGRLNLTLWYLYKITQVTHLSQTPPYTLSKGGAIQTMCCSVSNFNIFNTHVGLLSHHTVIIIRLGTLLPGPPGWEYTRMKSILIKILTLLEYNCVLGSPTQKSKEWSFLQLVSLSKNVSVTCICFLEFVVVQSLSCFRPHRLQHTRPPCPSLCPRACSNSCPLSQWCHPTISSSVAPFSSCLQSFPPSESFPVSQFFTSGSQSIRASASASVLPVNI